MVELPQFGAPSGGGHRGALRLSGALVALALLSACPDGSRKTESDGSTRSDAARADRPAGIGLRMVLPSGWTAQAEDEKSLVVGPRGRAVMKVQQTGLDELPDVQQLQSGFNEELQSAGADTLEARTEDDLTLWRMRLQAEDGGVSWSGFLGAKKVGAAIFLCSSLPGASDAEVTSAANACARLGE